MYEAHGAKFLLVPWVYQSLEMSFNSMIRLGCFRRRASRSSVRLVPFPPTNAAGLRREIPDHMVYLNALGQSLLVINSQKTAYELLDRRASIYSGRPRFIVAHETFCGGLLMVFMQGGDLSVSFLLKNPELMVLLVVCVAIAARAMKCYRK